MHDCDHILPAAVAVRPILIPHARLAAVETRTVNPAGIKWSAHHARVKIRRQPQRVGRTHRVVVAVGVPVVAVPRRVLADEAPRPAVVVAMPQKAQTAVPVRLVTARLPIPERCARPSGPPDQLPESVPVVGVWEPLHPGVRHPPQVAQAILGVEVAGVGHAPGPVWRSQCLADARRERGQPVRQDRGGGRNAVAEVGVAHAAISLGQAQPQAGVGVAVRVPVRQGGRGQPVLVVPGEARRLPAHRLRRQVAVEVVAFGLADPAGQLVVGVVGEGLCQRPVLGLCQPVAVVVVGVLMVGGEGAGPHFGDKLIVAIDTETLNSAMRSCSFSVSSSSKSSTRTRL